jgi:hypothetical protein
VPLAVRASSELFRPSHLEISTKGGHQSLPLVKTVSRDETSTIASIAFIGILCNQLKSFIGNSGKPATWKRIGTRLGPQTEVRTHRLQGQCRAKTDA